jgi:hypothetical protein
MPVTSLWYILMYPCSTRIQNFTQIDTTLLLTTESHVSHHTQGQKNRGETQPLQFTTASSQLIVLQLQWDILHNGWGD